MNYAEVPAFVASLQSRHAATAMVLEFVILTAARSGEALGARWEEIDLERAVWTVPAARMKAGREHRVPLSRRALKIVKARGHAPLLAQQQARCAVGNDVAGLRRSSPSPGRGQDHHS